MGIRNSSSSSHLSRLAVAVAVAIVLAVGIFAASHTTSAVEAAFSSPQPHGPQQPVLVELFTSEGCSSCPPADALLAQLDAEQFVPGAEAIVLSEHVSYWNGLGWKDPFSSQDFTDRQNDYGSRFGLSGVYTPQAVVDGSQELVGSDRGKLTQALKSAAARPKIPISVDNLQWSGDKVTAQITAGAAQKTTLFAALADDSDSSNVLRGENEGRNLRHVAVVRTLVELRKTNGPLDKLPVQIKLPASAQQPKMRLIVFLTDSHTGRVLGVTMQPLQRN
jgi:hypothetical protein